VKKLAINNCRLLFIMGRSLRKSSEEGIGRRARRSVHRQSPERVSPNRQSPTILPGPTADFHVARYNRGMNDENGPTFAGSLVAAGCLLVIAAITLGLLKVARLWRTENTSEQNRQLPVSR
jgi:hypothetical protein